jgi:glycerophosphoryl diester phosphodiesterase
MLGSAEGGILCYLRSAGWRDGPRDRVVLQSFDARALHVMKRLAPGIRRAALFDKHQDWMTVAKEFDATLLSLEHRLATPELVARAHRAGFEVGPWTADRPTDWARLADAGVDAIISDDPSALIASLKARGLRSKAEKAPGPKSGWL